MIATENPDLTRVMLRDLEEGKLENSDVYAALVRENCRVHSFDHCVFSEQETCDS